jgi:sugar (pentulose or hexulose) kinase
VTGWKRSRLCRRPAQQHPALAQSVAAIAVTGHMLGCLPVDATGQPLSRHLLHGDTRSLNNRKRSTRPSVPASSMR